MSWDSPSSFKKTEWFKFDTGKEHHVYLLMDKPITVFQHQVAEVYGKRTYCTFPCNFFDEEFRIGEGESISGLDSVEDPLWDELKEEDRYRKQDGELQRVDFPTKTQDFIWVWNIASSRKELLRFGPMLKEQLVEIQNVLGDLSNVKLCLKRTGSGKRGTKYTVVSIGAQELSSEVVEAREEVDIEDLIRLSTWFDKTKLEHVKAGTVEERE